MEQAVPTFVPEGCGTTEGRMFPSRAAFLASTRTILLIKNEGPVRDILGRHGSIMHRERLQRCRGLRLHSMPREVRGFGGCSGEHKRGAREDYQIFPHGTLLSDVQESNARSGITRCDGDHDGLAHGRKIDARVMRITSRNARIW